MKLRKLLKRFRLRSVQVGEGGRPEDNVDALATGAVTAFSGGRVAEAAPTNWVPSQQDERPGY
jgi:hypothetical protein